MSRKMQLPVIEMFLILLTALGCSANNDSASEKFSSSEESQEVAPEVDRSSLSARTSQESVSGEQEPTTALIPKSTTGFTAQLSAFKNRRNAERLEAMLQDDGLAVYMVEYDMPELGHYYRVRVGPFNTVTEAQTAGSQIVKDSAELVGFWVDNYPE